MNALITELKTRARLGLHALRRGDISLLERARRASHTSRRLQPVPQEWRLRDCLNLVAIEAGFDGWEHARRAFGERCHRVDDMGAFWHAPGCSGLLSHWFADYAGAQDCQSDTPGSVLLPYRRQFIVVDENYLRELGLAPDDTAWRQAEHDLVAAHGSAAWLRLCKLRLSATRPTRPSD